MITEQVIESIAPKAKKAAEIAANMAKYCPPAGIDTPIRQAHFLAQLAHESGGFIYDHELWGPTPAQKKYEGRKDLGNTVAGDGRRYAGRGYIQLTGRANYTTYGKALGLDLVGNPEIAATPEVAVRVAIEYWDSHHLNGFADKDDITTITRKINGGLNGLEDRKAYLVKAKKALGVRGP